MVLASADKNYGNYWSMVTFCHILEWYLCMNDCFMFCLSVKREIGTNQPT